MAGVAGPIAREDAEDVAAMMVATGRAVPASKWVDSLVEQAKRARFEGLF
jgi:hypothetical protein